jgi:5-methylcytosine-specific restriction endonuclease McrA
MQRVFVVDKDKQPLMPCQPARARQLLKSGQAAVYRRYPFTILLKERVGGDTQALEVKLDPGSKTTGLAVVGMFQRGPRLLWTAEVAHRGANVTGALRSRAASRRARRHRHTAYRPARFDNRRRTEGWLAPSLRSRVANQVTWVKRLQRLAPLTGIAQELVKFDMQLMQNAEISGIAYQQGELQGYEIRAYLLEKFQRTCVYCGKTNAPLEIEHVIPRSRGGSDRVSNLVLACHDCNASKGDRTAAEYGHPQVQALAKRSLSDAAALNTTRWILYAALTALGLPVTTSSGGCTSYNRSQQDYPKAHWIDAACVSHSGASVYINLAQHRPMLIKATGRQTRQMCLMDKYGFPRTQGKGPSTVHGFQTGDIVRAFNPAGKYPGWHQGRISVRASGSFAIADGATVSWRHCKRLQHSDGYTYKEGECAYTPA